MTVPRLEQKSAEKSGSFMDEWLLICLRVVGDGDHPTIHLLDLIHRDCRCRLLGASRVAGPTGSHRAVLTLLDLGFFHHRPVVRATTDHLRLERLLHRRDLGGGSSEFLQRYDCLRGAARAPRVRVLLRDLADDAPVIGQKLLEWPGFCFMNSALGSLRMLTSKRQSASGTEAFLGLKLRTKSPGSTWSARTLPSPRNSRS